MKNYYGTKSTDIFVEMLSTIILNACLDMDEEAICQHLRNLEFLHQSDLITKIVFKYKNDVTIVMYYHFFFKENPKSDFPESIISQCDYLSYETTISKLFSLVYNEMNASYLYKLFMNDGIINLRVKTLHHIRDLMNKIPEGEYKIRDSFHRVIDDMERYSY